MEEKKLTDEEIVKALLYCQQREQDCEKCYLHKAYYPCLCHRKLLFDTLDLIHRLQSRNELLESDHSSLLREADGYTQTISEQKAEIERLTEELQEADERIKYSDELLGKRREEISKLKKQVDELKFFEKKYNDLAKKYMADTKTADFIRHRAVKDTAKEIFAELFYIASIHHSDVANILAWAKEKAKSVGVEVE